ncbi:NACHT and Ankyrin domain protein [Metarhizium acridum CQMa 102]|uniref:NACHT and Ankyrin domain protein n=1 Tax=Metarhizium acridum (strain CQMa 102) TaxID=655827 RepID=E9E883_METAQ|nr:NACHT and Ankyrin domain protein [Metarhizium acridum CQMa 102]EFY87833.1 NACHT and Ankyrin domain protein [Metarhizium acridum CQMa 102]
MESSSKKRAFSVSGNPEAEQAVRKRHRLPQTCEWLRQEPVYQAWKSWNESSSPVLWIQGPVGIGKTFLADFVAGDVVGVSPESPVLTTHCTAQSTPELLVHDLAAQLVSRPEVSDPLKIRASKLVDDKYKDTASLPYDASYKTWDEFRFIVGESSRLTLIIDGLDELPNESLSHLKFDLPSRLVELTTTLAENVRLLVLSRPQSSILRALRDSPTIQVTATKVADDMRQFCLSEAAKYPQLGLEADNVSTAVARKSEGIFIWASLAIKVLASETKTSEGNIDSRLGRLPTSLNGLYRDAFEQQSKNLHHTHIVLRDIILRWLAFSVRPMTPVEVANAISTETNIFIADLEATAVEVCGSLVKFEAGYLRLVHHSLLDFLHSKASSPAENEATWVSEQHHKITACLLAYLMHTSFRHVTDLPSSKDFRNLYPLAEYACLYWVHHLSLSKEDRHLKDQVELFFQSTNAKEWVIKLLPELLAHSVLPIPPRPPINARFFYISMLKAQVVNYFEQARRNEVRRNIDRWLESIYEGLFAETSTNKKLTPTECLRRRIELAELYSWLPERGDRVAPQLTEAIEISSPSMDGENCQDLVIAARQALADDLKRNGRYADAEELLKRLIEDIIRTSSDENPALSFAYDSLGWVLSRQGRLEDAKTFLRNAVEASTQQFGSSSPHTLRSRLTLAEILAKLGRNDEAQELYRFLENRLRKSDRDGEQITSDLPKDAVADLNILAGIYMQQGKYSEAKTTFRMVVDERKKMFGPNSRLTLWAEMQYGLAANGEGDAEQAEAILSVLLPRQIEVLGLEHQDVKDVTKVLQDIKEKET